LHLAASSSTSEPGDGTRGSNSLYFENLGWRGLCVDADPRNHEPLRPTGAASSKPAAVSSTPGLRPFGMYAHKPSWSGLQRHGDDYQQIMVRCARLDTLLERTGIDEIDLLSIDVEGTELGRLGLVRIDPPPAFQSSSSSTTTPGRIGPAKQYVATSAPRTYEVIHRTPANLILERTDRRWIRRP